MFLKTSHLEPLGRMGNQGKKEEEKKQRHKSLFVGYVLRYLFRRIIGDRFQACDARGGLL